MKKTSLLVFLPAAAWAQTVDLQAKYTPCIDYYTVGESSCRPAASTPVYRPGQVQQPTLLSPPAAPQSFTDPEQAKVDKYLENYGKPPREFVEFYLNPTPENAVKWVAAYQQLVQRGKALSEAWNQADELYQQGRVALPAADENSLPPVTDFGPLLQKAPAANLQSSQIETQDAPRPQKTVATESIGAFSPESPVISASKGVDVTYYFSATCPYCAQLTPQLADIYEKMPSKFAFTCVDVTPLGATTKPQKANIEGKLPCQWRLPRPQEIENMGIRQTPTLVIRRPGNPDVRLSGYVPPVQLLPYLQGGSSQ